MAGKPESAKPIDEYSGKLAQQDEEKLLNSVMEGDRKDDASIVMNA